MRSPSPSMPPPPGQEPRPGGSPGFFPVVQPGFSWHPLEAKALGCALETQVAVPVSGTPGQSLISQAFFPMKGGAWMRGSGARSPVLKFFPTVGTKNSHISASPGPAWDPTPGRCLGFRKGCCLSHPMSGGRREGASGEGAGIRPGVLATGPLPSKSLGPEESGKAQMESLASGPALPQRAAYVQNGSSLGIHLPDWLLCPSLCPA